MYKIITAFLVMTTLLFLVGCKQKNEIEKRIEYLNSKDISFWQFKEDNNFDSTVNRNFVFESFTDIEYSNKYTIIIIDTIKFYKDINVDMTNAFYDHLEGKKSVAVIYLNAPDYNFFSGTKFANDKDFYGNPEYINLFYNFDNLTPGLKNKKLDFDTDNPDYKFSLAIISLTHDIVSAHEGAL